MNPNGNFLFKPSASSSSSSSGADASYDLNNLAIATSVSSNALTIALKGKDGNDPSVSNTVSIGFRSSTLTSGVYALRTVTSALSLVISSGSTLGTASGVAQYLYVYAIDNGGTVELAISGVIFDEGQRVSTTAEGGAGGADLIRVMYSTTARSDVACRLIGRILITEATAGTWASNATALAVMPFQLQPPVAAYYSSANRALTSGVTDINFDTKITDTHNSMASGVYTVPMSGKYSVSSHMRTTAGTLDILSTKSGTLYDNIGTATSQDTGGGSTIMDCVAGDTISIRGGQSVTASAADGVTKPGVYIHWIGP